MSIHSVTPPRRVSPQRSSQLSPQRPATPGRPRARAAADPSSATVLVEVAVSGTDALDAATRLAREIRDLVDSVGAEPSGVEMSAAVGLQLGVQRTARPPLSSVGALPHQGTGGAWTSARPPARAKSPASAIDPPPSPARVQLPSFVAPSPVPAGGLTAGTLAGRPAAAGTALIASAAPAARVATPDGAAASAGQTASADGAAAPTADMAPLRIYPARRVALLGGEQVSLTRREFDLLLFLSEHAGRVFDRPQLLRLVWGHQVICGERTVDVHIRRLRAKVEATGPVISTVRGVGYRLDAADRVAVVHERG